jgi:hypothetical protein
VETVHVFNNIVRLNGNNDIRVFESRD